MKLFWHLPPNKSFTALTQTHYLTPIYDWVSQLFGRRLRRLTRGHVRSLFSEGCESGR